MAEKKTEMPFRVALREEGEMWNAYLAPEGSMDNALLLGSIRLSIVQKNPAFKDAFMDMMVAVVGVAIEDVIGVLPDFVIRGAPDYEREG
jgi:hypothetical protein